jgi:hypothetical protein
MYRVPIAAAAAGRAYTASPQTCPGQHSEKVRHKRFMSEVPAAAAAAGQAYTSNTSP